MSVAMGKKGDAEERLTRFEGDRIICSSPPVLDQTIAAASADGVIGFASSQVGPSD